MTAGAAIRSTGCDARGSMPSTRHSRIFDRTASAVGLGRADPAIEEEGCDG
jgi:hypothetical protein